MDEREKIKAIVKQFEKQWFYEKVIQAYSVHDDEYANRLTDLLIAAGIRDITRQGYICMNGEVIVPTPNIYNKVADILACPRIKEG